jgi:hypothetical protein
MTIVDIFQSVNDDPNLEGLGVEDGFFYVRHIPRDAVYRIPADACKMTWRDLRDCLYGLKTFMPISHMTRVCGYYSRVENWNPSKVSELHDRHRGNYSVQ